MANFTRTVNKKKILFPKQIWNKMGRRNSPNDSSKLNPYFVCIGGVDVLGMFVVFFSILKYSEF